MIDTEILLKNGGVLIKFKKNQTIFFEGNTPLFYYQIIEGCVKMVNVNISGKEFIQGMFTKSQSFGEPVLIIDEVYPATAVVCEDSSIIKLDKAKFLNILYNYPDILLQFVQLFAKRIYDKTIISKEIAIHDPEHRIIKILNLVKKNIAGQARRKFKVEISRQQIADMTALRVETVIRTIKVLQKKEQIIIIKGKIYM